MSQRNLFPHMVIGKPKKRTTQFITDFAIPYELTPSTDFEAIVHDVEVNGTLDSIKTLATTTLDAEFPILTRNDIRSIFPELDEYLEDIETFILTFVELSPAEPTLTIPSSLTSAISDVWDALFLHYIDNKNPALLNDLINTLKIYTLSPLSLTGNDFINWWKKSYILFPNPPFPLPKPEPVEISGTVPTPESETDYTEEIIALGAARQEIFEAFQLQLLTSSGNTMTEAEFTKEIVRMSQESYATPKTFDAPDPGAEFTKYQATVNSYRLSTATGASLSTETITTLSSNNLPSESIHVLFTLRGIDSRISFLSNKVSLKPHYERLIAVGGSILSVDDAIYGQIICSEDTSLSHCALLHSLSSEAVDNSYVRVLGMGYANVIRQQVVRNEADEIAHIETVLKGEHKEKTHRNLTIKEEFSFSQKESNKETETDTKTSNRFELSKEVSSMMMEEEQLQAGVNISASYGGVVTIGTNLGYATGSSSTEAASSSVQMAKEISERATQRIQERSLEIRESRTINETEITNVHGIDNAAGTDHINGFYYWVDKVYENQVFNIGKRLMLEFMIPEPAAYHIYAMATSKRAGVTIDKPIHPKDYKGDGLTDSLKSFSDINRINYKLWASAYGAQDIAPPPPDKRIVAANYCLDYQPQFKEWHDFAHKEIAIPEGYEADMANVLAGFSGGSGFYVSTLIGANAFTFYTSSVVPTPVQLNGETDIVPLSIRGNFQDYILNIEVLCNLTDAEYDKWRISTYNSILNAYNQLNAEYENALGQLESSIRISGQNPRVNRATEQEELKKWAIELLTLQRFDGLSAMKKASNGAPEIDFEEAFAEGSFVSYFEQAIEWHNMTYLFYPYFWAHKQRWSTLKKINDVDEKFTKFLQAGYARVVVPVHPKFTASILHYVETGEIWNGESLPAIDDELYLSIIEEIQEMEDNTNGEEVGDPWETRVPTNLVMITSDIPANLPGS